MLPDRLDLIRQKLLKNAKYDQFDEVYENLKLEAYSQTVLPDRSILIGRKLLKKCQILSIWRVFENLKLLIKQCYQVGDSDETKFGAKCQNPNETFWVHGEFKSLCY